MLQIKKTNIDYKFYLFRSRQLFFLTSSFRSIRLKINFQKKYSWVGLEPQNLCFKSHDFTTSDAHLNLNPIVRYMKKFVVVFDVSQYDVVCCCCLCMVLVLLLLLSMVQVLLWLLLMLLLAVLCCYCCCCCSWCYNFCCCYNSLCQSCCCSWCYLVVAVHGAILLLLFMGLALLLLFSSLFLHHSDREKLTSADDTFCEQTQDLNNIWSVDIMSVVDNKVYIGSKFSYMSINKVYIGKVFSKLKDDSQRSFVRLTFKQFTKNLR